MDAGRWQRFIAYLERARAKPTFESEEREYRLQIAAELRDALQSPADAAPVDSIRAVFERPRPGRPYQLTRGIDHRWLAAWAGMPDSSLPAVLRDFTQSGADPIARFERFAQAAEEAGRAGNVGAVVAVGSLLNFALAPDSAPVVKPEPFDEIEATLGYRVSGHESAAEQYRRHLRFVSDVLARARDAGIAVADTLDAEALIMIASDEAPFWAGDVDGEGPLLMPHEGAPYLSVCAIFRDEAPYLREWIEFHRLVGVARFFLYDHESTDHSRDVLAPYVEDGTVVVHPWRVIAGPPDKDFRGVHRGLNPQRTAYNDCLRWHRRDSRWIAFIDLDEFLFSPAGDPLPEVLKEYEQWPGVVANWAMFHSGGHRAQPAGPVIGNYRVRVNSQKNHIVKSIVQPAYTVANRSGHNFRYAVLSAVDENHYPADGFWTKSVSFSRLRINHYFTKSEEEFLRKLDRQRVHGPEMKKDRFDLESLRQLEEQTGTPDEAILIYLEALEARLAEQREPV
jgi:Glycosyltransferase family 92